MCPLSQTGQGPPGSQSVPRVLMIAYHFPPHSGTSGVQRALRFSSYLPDFGWEPIVLTADPRVYDHRSPDLLSDVRSDLRVIRAPALDTRKHVAIGGRYPGFLARPDRWHWWRFAAIPMGLAAVRRYRPAAIWSTYPIPTAHSIGCAVARMTGLPLIADFRDPMAQDDYPEDPATWRSFARIEERTVRRAARSVFTTPGARELYAGRYPGLSSRFDVIENGYDESAFDGLHERGQPLNPGRVTLLHSGVVYPEERDPSGLFQALAMLRSDNPGLFERLTVRFRASMADELLAGLAQRYEIEGAIEILSALPYREALAEMIAADGLLVLQAANCNAQIPAKLYEYLRARRPLLVLSDPAGDTAAVARGAGVENIAQLDEPAEILELLGRFFADGSQLVPTVESVADASRYSRTRELAALLDTVAASHRG